MPRGAGESILKPVLRKPRFLRQNFLYLPMGGENRHLNKLEGNAQACWRGGQLLESRFRARPPHKNLI